MKSTLLRPNEAISFLSNRRLPREHRSKALAHVVNEKSEESDAIVESILQGLESTNVAARQHADETAAFIEQLEEGAWQRAVVLDVEESAYKTGSKRATVAIEGGDVVCATVATPDLWSKLKPGFVVVLDLKRHAILAVSPSQRLSGEAVVFEKRHACGIEVSWRNDERLVLLPSSNLAADIEKQVVNPGDKLMANMRLGMAFAHLPPDGPDAMQRWRYLDHVIPTIGAQHLGSPDPVIQDVLNHVRVEMDPEKAKINRRYGVPASMSVFLVGRSGSGKTATISAIIHGIHSLVGKHLPNDARLTLRAKADNLLSKWLGESNRNIASLFKEAKELSVHLNKLMQDGFRSPVVIVLEEIDGIGRARGSDSESHHDRILTTLLEHMGSDQDRERFYVILATSNVADLVDPALVRRIGGKVVNIGRLNRRSFESVFDSMTLTTNLPAASNNGFSPNEIWARHRTYITDYLFSPKSADPGLVEVTYAGSATPVTRYAREFLTPALIRRAVDEAAREAVQAELNRVANGIALSLLAHHFEQQLASLANQVTVENLKLYTDIPEGSRVASVKKVKRPTAWPLEFITASTNHNH